MTWNTNISVSSSREISQKVTQQEIYALLNYTVFKGQIQKKKKKKIYKLCHLSFRAYMKTNYTLLNYLLNLTIEKWATYTFPGF